MQHTRILLFYCNLQHSASCSTPESCFSTVIYSDYIGGGSSANIQKLFLDRSDLIIDRTCYEAMVVYLFRCDSLLELQPVLNDTRFDKNKVTESGDAWLYLAMNNSLERCNRKLFNRDDDGLSLFIKHKKNKLLKEK